MEAMKLGLSRFRAASVAPTVNACLDAFGEERVVFGGDWPVCTLGSSLAQWVAALKEIIANRPSELQEKLFSLNAEQIYQL